MLGTESPGAAGAAHPLLAMTNSVLALVRDLRLSPHVTSPVPAWLCGVAPLRLIWSNPAAAGLRGSQSLAAVAPGPISPRDPLAIDIARLSASLPVSGAARLERIRGLSAGIGRTMVCACSRLSFDEETAILMVAAEPAVFAMPLAERVRRAFADAEGAMAVFSRDGALLHASPDAAIRIGEITTLTAFGAYALAAEALRSGRAGGNTPIGAVEFERVGNGDNAVVLAILDAQPNASQAPSAEFRTNEGPGPIEPTTAKESPAAAPVMGNETAAAAEGEPPPAGAVERADAASAAVSPGPHRRHPIRFVWQIDTDGRFTLGSREFAQAVGAQELVQAGRTWNEVAAELGLDPDQRVERAIASRETWSGITVAWPVEGSEERLTVELSGVPVFDRDRAFRGYRGFGVCRNIAQLAAAMASPSGLPISASPPDRAAASSNIDVREAAGRPATESRPQLTLVPAAKNVVPFRSAAANERRPALSAVERTAFTEIGEALTSGLPESPETAVLKPDQTLAREEPPAPLADDAAVVPSALAPGGGAAQTAATAGSEAMTLDRLPIGVLVYRGSRLIHANRVLLDWTGHEDLGALTAAGGLDRIFAEPAAALDQSGETGQALAIITRTGAPLAVEGRLFSVSWGAETAFMLVLLQAGDRLVSFELAQRRAEADVRELRSILDTATDGVVVIERDGRIVSLNRSAEALFGYESRELVGGPFDKLFAPESQRAALDYLDGLSLNGVASVLNDGREVIGRVREGGLIPLFMTMGRIADGTDKFCAVFRDITQWKRAEEDLLNAKREAERASSAKSDFLAKISHEIRTPLNAIIGFSEVMMDERFGPVGNDRYRQYLKDIHASGGHLVSLLNDLLDLSKIEAGKLDLTFTSVDLTALLQQCVAIMQPQANRERIIIRTSLLPTLPAVVVDERSIRQIVLNLLSNSIKFTGAGGQVIVSTALTERGEAVLRVRDTGIGMSEQEIETALEPFRQLATSTRWGSGGTGLGLPLTKALVEANRATFAIKSAVNAGTLVEITFPATRVLAE
jgi:PAS domain S-box-containing protein